MRIAPGYWEVEIGWGTRAGDYRSASAHWGGQEKSAMEAIAAVAKDRGCPDSSEWTYVECTWRSLQ